MIKKTKKYFFSGLAVLFISMSLIFLGQASSVHAFDSQFFTPTGLFDRLSAYIPRPIADFINSAKQIEENLVRKSPQLDFGKIAPGNIYDSINNWFSKITGGVSLTQIIRPIGNLIASILSFVADLIRRAVSWI